MPETLVAHCGACAREMVLAQDRPDDAEAGHATLVRFVCRGCGYETPWRATLAAAAADAVWAPLKRSRAARTGTAALRQAQGTG